MKALLLLLLALPASAAHGGLDVYADGASLHRLEGDAGAGVALRYRRSDDGGKTWSKPVRVDGGRPAYHFAAGDARVAAEGNSVFALWSRPGKGPHGAGPLAMARSTDGGKTWTAAAGPSADGTFGRRFPALSISSGALNAIWLDRESNAKLFTSRSTDGAKTWSKPAVLDDDACECCWNAALASADGTVYALYRDKDPRDMKVAVSRDGGKTWGKPAAAGPFGWDFNGCPHVGGALAATKTGVAALVWTGKDADMGLYVFASSDGKSWTEAVKLGGPAAKHADLASSGGGLAAAWDEDGKIFSATSRDGKTWLTRPVAAGENAGNPRVVAAGTGFRVFWPGGDRELALEASH